jgi:tripartite-type tricarboxylate transporter receptor subunit TctC
MLPKFSALAVVALTFVALTLAAPPAHAQPDPAAAYPNRAVKIIVSAPPGGGLDIAARVVADRLAKLWGQPFVVENRPGAAGNIGTASVAKASADGYTLLLVLDTPLTVNPWLYAKLPFEPVQDFAPISTVASFSLMLVAHPSMTVNTVSEFVAHARARKDRPLIYGSGGAPGSPGHLAMEYLRMQAGFPGVHVPHKGNAEVVISLVGGQVESGFLATPGVLQNVRDGRLKAFAVSSPRRTPLAPDVPTMAESGFSGFEVRFFLMLLAPASIPEPIRAVLEREVQAAMQSPHLRERLRVQDLEPIGSTGAETKDLIKATGERWRSVIKSANIRAD